LEILVVNYKMNAKNEGHVKIENRISTSSKKTKGLKQGCSLSLTLYTVTQKVYCMTGTRSAQVWECQ
jgi:hypothetical protein